MNTDSPDALDQLLEDWAAAREAGAAHSRRLSEHILAAARTETRQAANENVARTVVSDTEPNGAPLPELRKALFRPTATSTADWGGRLMVGGGGLLLFLFLAGGLLYYNLAMGPAGTPRQTRIALSGATPPTVAGARELPAAASLGANDLAMKRQLLAETNALFDNRLAWIADGEREVSFDLLHEAASKDGEFMLVRVVVARRLTPDSPWSTIWQADVISRSEALVEISPRQLDGSSLALWTYLMSDGEVAVEMDLMLDQETQRHSSSSTVLQAGQPTRVGCSTEDGVEQCVFQTVMPLSSSRI